MFLGIDLGEKTTGLAISDSSLATSYATIHHKNTSEALRIIMPVIEKEGVDTVVVGFVEGKIKPLFENFAKKLRQAKPDLKVILWDETLTSRQATETMVKLGIARKKRAKKQHEAAATLILQSYLDEKLIGKQS
jgi:putative Holliday junction resolvase